MSLCRYEFAGPHATATQLATDVASLLRQGLNGRAKASPILSGGRSPALVFKALSTANLAWDRVTLKICSPS